MRTFAGTIPFAKLQDTAVPPVFLLMYEKALFSAGCDYPVGEAEENKNLFTAIIQINIPRVKRKKYAPTLHMGTSGLAATSGIRIR